ncbi:glycosyltransferase family 2 protein [soil metagenome]
MAFDVAADFELGFTIPRTPISEAKAIMIATLDDTARMQRTGLMPRDVELTVVMPCLNEERTVGICVRKAINTINDLGIEGEVLVIDNGSTDNSIAIAEAAGARVVRHHLKGYGNALRRGFDEARGTYIIMGDADDSYDFTDLGRFVAKLRNGADICLGNRLGGEIKPGAMPKLHQYFGNPGLTWLTNRLFNAQIGDVYCGMRGFKKDAVRRLGLNMPGMELATEMVIKGKLSQLRFDEIPITLHKDGRDRKPHLRSFRDGWRTLRFMLMLCPTVLFLLPGLLMFVVGLAAIPVTLAFGRGDYFHYFGPNFLYGSSVIALTGFHLMIFGWLAKLHAARIDPVVFGDPRVDKVTSFFRVERGLLYGGTLLAMAAAIGIPVVVNWWQTTQVPNPGWWIFAGTLFTLGIETVSLSFLVGILDLSRERSRVG